MLRSQRQLLDIYDIFEVSTNGRLLGFGRGGKKIFKEIAKTRFHLSNSYCGNVEIQFCITKPGLNVLCPFTSMYTTFKFLGARYQA